MLTNGPLDCVGSEVNDYQPSPNVLANLNIHQLVLKLSKINVLPVNKLLITGRSEEEGADVSKK